jgi:hypothetical protein
LDPAEEVNVAARHPEVVERLGQVLADWYATRPEGFDRGAKLDVERLDSRSRGLLEALGYLEPSAQAPGEPPSPTP